MSGSPFCQNLTSFACAHFYSHPLISWDVIVFSLTDLRGCRGFDALSCHCRLSHRTDRLLSVQAACICKFDELAAHKDRPIDLRLRDDRKGHSAVAPSMDAIT